MKTILSVLLFCTAVFGSNDYFCRLDRIVQERKCTAAGGICTFAVDCPNPAAKGQCPGQQRQGIECCYGVSIRETRCKKNGGECIPASRSCPDNLTFKRATDCGRNEKCCIFV